MTHEQLVEAVYSRQLSAVYCFNENCCNNCRECSENLVREYENEIKTKTIDEIVNTLSQSEETILSDRQYFELIKMKGGE